MVIDGLVFVAYVEERLAPMLKCNDIVVMDNLPAHKVPGVKEVIEAFGAPWGARSRPHGLSSREAGKALIFTHKSDCSHGCLLKQSNA